MDCVANATGTACLKCGWIKPAKIKGWPRRNCRKPPEPPTDTQRAEVIEKMRDSIIAIEPLGSLEIAGPRLAICQIAPELTANGCVEKAGCGDCWPKWRARLVDPHGQCPLGKWPYIESPSVPLQQLPMSS